MSNSIDVLEVWDEARRFARDQSTSYETPYHLFTAMDEARAAVAELRMQHRDLRWLVVRALSARTDDTPKALVEDMRAALERCKG